MVKLAERRRHQRSRIDWPVSLYHPDLGMFLNGRSVDVSRGGARVDLPTAVPIKPGQTIEVNFPRTATLAKLAGSYSRIKSARVVRVEHRRGLGGFDDIVGKPPARVTVSLQFAPAGEGG